MSDNQAWANYAGLFLDEFDDTKENRELIDYVGDKEIAAVIKYHFRATYKNWLTSKVDALDGKTPSECLKSERGRSQLKEILMRMH
ncbi:MbcA/ParS/Xre antitoxin family protein [Microbulbifer sp. GL-2]|uniref:MbcA/ParS/Xre antitoxin family protein n=1 Tax=Microbulbifer sp. GL-2 TaxID=2591606 RepID=UPI0011644A9A|nr:MbcA/ParS/Xre antitoxin family protein [Microbulbifer sp. GL-2]BBM02233.1 hypothetical protein GL2_23070 [Microbulbifer sp. GL-2]